MSEELVMWKKIIFEEAVENILERYKTIGEKGREVRNKYHYDELISNEDKYRLISIYRGGYETVMFRIEMLLNANSLQCCQYIDCHSEDIFLSQLTWEVSKMCLEHTEEDYARFMKTYDRKYTERHGCERID